MRRIATIGQYSSNLFILSQLLNSCKLLFIESIEPNVHVMASYNNYEVPNDTIFVTGLPEDTTDEQLAEFFGQIGIIKYDKKNERPKIWIYKDKTTGKGKGEATITYDDPPTATSAITWFDGKFEN